MTPFPEGGREGGARSEILCGPGAARSLPLAAMPSGRAFLVSSETVLKLHGDRLRGALFGREVVEIGMDDREEAKTLDTARGILDRAIASEIRRDDFVVGFGGGVVTDVAGFAAAIALRGVAWMAVPTTLLAMADAAIGGKTGVDHPLGKNLIGAFHFPAAVIADTELLETLPPRQIRSGLVEIYKTLLVGDAGRARAMTGRLAQLAESRDLGDALAAAMRIKVELTAADPYERDRRRWLNLGHTAGHALEACGAYRTFTHGEAVAAGLAAALLLSSREAGFPPEEARAMARELSRFCGAERLRTVDPADPRFSAALSRDKKRRAGESPAVLLEAPGRPVVRAVPEGWWREAIREVIALAGG